MNETPRRPKKPANVSLDPELLAEAKKLGINLSRTLEERLTEIIHAERIKRWQEENKDAIDSYNRFIEENGIFGAEYRNW